jgi:hypothetical protein
MIHSLILYTDGNTNEVINVLQLVILGERSWKEINTKAETEGKKEEIMQIYRICELYLPIPSQGSKIDFFPPLFF